VAKSAQGDARRTKSFVQPNARTCDKVRTRKSGKEISGWGHVTETTQATSGRPARRADLGKSGGAKTCDENPREAGLEGGGKKKKIG